MEHYRIVLIEPEHQGNVGSIARSMRNFNLRDLWIVKPRTTIGLEAQVFAAHGQDVLAAARIVRNLGQAIEGCATVVGTSSIANRSTSNLRRNAIDPHEFARRMASKRSRVAILFGRESSGLSNEEIEMCDFLVSIPASKEYGALNVAQAATIVFYELFRNKSSRNEEPVASAGSKRRLTHYFETLCDYSDTRAHRKRLSSRAFRSIVSRATLTPREATLLIGVFRRALRQRSKRKIVRSRKT